MAKIYLAYGKPGRPTLLHPACPPVRLLVSMAYIADFRDLIARGCRPIEWVLDSGAYSFKHSGTEMTYEKWKDGVFAARELPCGPPSEVYALDVIGDARASLVNAERARAEGLDVIPCYHIGEPIEVFHAYCSNYPKVAFGGVARLHGKAIKEWVARLFRASWPKALHGFGAVRPELLEAFPLDSVDSSSWSQRTYRYGDWAGYGRLAIRDSLQQLVMVVQHYQRRERESESKWSRELERVRSYSTQAASTAP